MNPTLNQSHHQFSHSTHKIQFLPDTFLSMNDTIGQIDPNNNKPKNNKNQNQNITNKTVIYDIIEVQQKIKYYQQKQKQQDFKYRFKNVVNSMEESKIFNIFFNMIFKRPSSFDQIQIISCFLAMIFLSWPKFLLYFIWYRSYQINLLSPFVIQLSWLILILQNYRIYQYKKKLKKLNKIKRWFISLYEVFRLLIFILTVYQFVYDLIFNVLADINKQKTNQDLDMLRYIILRLLLNIDLLIVIMSNIYHYTINRRYVKQLPSALSQIGLAIINKIKNTCISTTNQTNSLTYKQKKHIQVQNLKNQIKWFYLLPQKSNHFEECPICSEQLLKCNMRDEEVDSAKFLIRLKCQHFFHQQCIVQWINISQKQTCPMCRRQIQKV